MNYLNLGCGSRFHPSWTNIDFISGGNNVIAYDLNQGIPFADNFFDVVYHSHVLEHFPKNKAEYFLGECYRVLRPEGVLRVVIPDLEQIAKIYLLALEQARTGDKKWNDNYDWIMLEMYDQVVRNISGGDMLTYLSNPYLSNEDFVIKRCGIEARKIIESQKSILSQDTSSISLLKIIYKFLRYSTYRKNILLKILLGSDYNSLQIGRFRQSGEIHHWMYDSYSLGRLLENSGFKEIKVHNSTSSYISDWSKYNLDTEPNGSVYKPDSLYIEAIKP